jgi:hypothetical protein
MLSLPSVSRSQPDATVPEARWPLRRPRTYPLPPEGRITAVMPLEERRGRAEWCASRDCFIGAAAPCSRPSAQSEPDLVATRGGAAW